MLAVALAIAVLLGLIAALLAVPVMLVIDAERVEALKARWRIRWLFGLVDVRLPRERASPPAPEPADITARPAKSAGNSRRKARMALAALRTRGLVSRVARATSDVFRHVRLDEFRLETAFGFDNPADTGIVYGVLSPLLVLAEQRGLNVECRPMFVESGLQGALRAAIHVRPLAVAGTLCSFLLSRPVRRAVKSAWRARK
jgi:hypothetical protein